VERHNPKAGQADGLSCGAAPYGAKEKNVTSSGCEWIVEAHHCDAASVSDPAVLHALFERLILEMGLHPIGETRWHQFPGGGITGLALLQESHIACHTFPEHRSLCLNVFCCRPRPDWDFDACLRREFGATSVEVRRIARPYVTGPDSA
jgi:S-adenosylmethionine decarboxylase